MQSYGAFDLSKFAEKKHRFYDLGIKRMADVAEELEAQMMATATLLNVGTPGPALNLNKTAQTTGYSILSSDAQVTQSVAGTVYQLDSISITAGTWIVIGITSVLSGTQTNYLNLVTATGSNSWPVQATASSVTTNMAIAAVIKVSSTTTIYLNGKNASAAIAAAAAMFAVQIA